VAVTPGFGRREAPDAAADPPREPITPTARSMSVKTLLDAGSPMIDNMLTLLQANSHVYVDFAGLIWSYPRVEVDRYIQRLVEAGFEDRIMSGTDQLV
jgi:hypothetical protein